MRPAKEVHYTKKMTLDQVLTFSFSNIFKQIGAYSQWLLLSLMVVVINLIPVGILLFSLDFSGSIPFYMAPETTFEKVNPGMIGLATVCFIIAIMIDLFFAFYSTNWFFRVGLDGYDSIKRSFGERIRVSFKDLGPIAAVALLLGIVSFIIMLPYLAVNMMGTIGNDPSLSLLGSLIYFITLPFIYFISVKCSCTYGLILEEHKSVMEALKQSWAMTKGRGWRIFGYMFLVGLLAALLIFALFIPAIILWIVAALAEFSPAITGFTVLVSIVTYMIILCIQYGISANISIAVYKRLTIEHAEEEQTPGLETPAPLEKDDIQF